MNRRLMVMTVILLCCGFTTYSQSVNSKKEQLSLSSAYQYYIYLGGVNTKDDVIYLENTIETKQGVTYFLGNQFPVRYFLLKSNKAISATTFANWVGSKYPILYFKEGEFGKEGALMTGINLNKKKLATNQN